MSLWALEIDDAGLALAGPSGLHAIEPGYAWIDDGRVLLGREARAHCRLRPRQSFTEYWSELRVEPLANATACGRSSAELAALQLRALWEQALTEDPEAEGVLLAVPGELDRARLGCLLGATEACGAPLSGLVDLAVAACRPTPPGWQLLHAEVGLHHVRLTQLSQHEGLQRTRFAVLPEAGLLRLRDRWMRAIAERFIARTRYDPMHDAVSEQQLHDQLDAWLSQWERSETIELALSTARETRSIELSRRELLAATRAAYQRLVRWIAGLCAPGVPVALQLGARLAGLPGVVAALERLEDARVVVLPEAAGALGALRRERAVRAGDDPYSLVTQLPLEEPALPLEKPPPRSAADAGPAPTHLLYQGRAHRIDRLGFAIGVDRVPPGRGLQLTAPEPLAGISRRHCVLFPREGELILQDQSRYGTFVNERRSGPETRIFGGDVIRVGTPGVELGVLGLEDERGA